MGIPLQPIIVYGVKFVKSFRGEDIGYARFEGLYLPLLWEQSFCIKSPIALGYTRGHFSALVPTEPYSRIDAARDDSEDVTFLPLMDCEQKLLPIHFLTQNEVSFHATLDSNSHHHMLAHSKMSKTNLYRWDARNQSCVNGWMFA